MIGSSFSVVVYCAMSFLGYLIYGDSLTPNYLTTVTKGDIGQTIYIVLQSCYVVIMLMSYPLMFYEARNISLYYAGLYIPFIRKAEINLEADAS